VNLAGQAWQGWTRTGGLARLDRGGGNWGSEIKRDVVVLDKNTRGTSFIVTRATTAIALHLLHTVHLAALQSVWVLTTHVTYSTKYRRSGYAPGFFHSNKIKQKRNNKRKNQKPPSFHRENKRNGCCGVTTASHRRSDDQLSSAVCQHVGWAG
jgi:hypothetical protein